MNRWVPRRRLDSDPIVRVEIVSANDLAGGAARAAFRLVRALHTAPSVSASMLVQHRTSDDPFVRQMRKSAYARAFRLLFAPFVHRIMRLQRNPANVSSVALLPSGLPRAIDPRADITHLHWVNADMVSIAEIAQLRGPLIWTLHDTWPLSGTEHYPYSLVDRRFTLGYARHSRPAGHTGLDVDRWTWQRKHKHWREPIHLVCPSRWMQQCAQDSPLTASWPTTVIPNPLDTETFKPLDRAFCREALGLPHDAPLVLFGAHHGTKDHRKGFDLLLHALEALREPAQRPVEFVVFGQSEPREPPRLPGRGHWTGPLQDDVTLCLLYNSANVFVLPSRQENLPQTATEAQACGCPVVAFDTCGVGDVVVDGITGYLAEPYEPASFARGIARVLGDPETAFRLGRAARKRAVDLWSYQVVTPQFVQMYRQVLQTNASRH
jgi:glycosyltransferase involved in cell wall biosynthesis